MTRNDWTDRQGQDLAELALVASTADEAARWLRNSLARIRTGHEVEFEIRSAEQAIQTALERITRTRKSRSG